MAPSSTKPKPQSAENPLGPQGARVELKQDANAIVINSACNKCIKDNVPCKVEEEGKPCTHCKDDKKANRDCNAHGLVPDFSKQCTFWPLAAAIVHIAEIRDAARRRHFEAPRVSCLIDCFEHVHDMLLWYKEWGLLPDWCPTLDLEAARKKHGQWTSVDDIEDLPASLVRRVIEWRDWEKLCPLATAIPPPVFRDNWLEREEREERRKRARR